MSAPLLAFRNKSVPCGRWELWRRGPWGSHKAFLCLAAAAGFLGVFSSFAMAQQFSNVSDAAGIIHMKTRAWGNPIWGDINGDGFPDLIVPKHEISAAGLHRPGPP